MTVKYSGITSEKLAELVAAARKKREQEKELEREKETCDRRELVAVIPSSSNFPPPLLPLPSIPLHPKTTEPIQYNAEQHAFISLATELQSCILIGAAGTGKTTCMKGTAFALEQSGKIPLIPDTFMHKYLPVKVPGILFVAFTRRAVNNLKRALPAHLKGNAITIHKALEYEPNYYDVIDPSTGKQKKTMKFEPTRNAIRPLCDEIRTVVIDESSMVSVELFKELENAPSPRTQFIFLGDIQQLPPVFGSAILGYKMLELPTIELTQVYRQALESPIIRLAHRILSGKPIPVSEYKDWKSSGQLTIHPWKKKLHEDIALLTAAKFFTAAIDAGEYSCDEDMILIPFNKGCGTTELNKHLAQHLTRKRGAEVHEIIAGFNKHYYASGDKVLYDKEDAQILSITPSKTYVGASYQPASVHLDYWGHSSLPSANSDGDAGDMDFLLGQVASASGDDDEERVKIASHIVKLRLFDSDREIEISTASELNTLVLGYALTVHKSQGSEWRKVFVVFHQSHATKLQRELLYTAVTRAREELYVICEPESFTNGIRSQRIKGNSLAEKAAYFKGKLEKQKDLLG